MVGKSSFTELHPRCTLDSDVVAMAAPYWTIGLLPMVQNHNSSIWTAVALGRLAETAVLFLELSIEIASKRNKYHI